MYIKTIQINNFRKLYNTTIDLAKQTTIIVGRNNTGKTSVVEIINKFFNATKFTFEDFSVATIKDIKANIENPNYAIPAIELKIVIEYNEDEDLTNISRLITDLDDTNKTVCIIFKYIGDKLKLEKLNFSDLHNTKFKSDFTNCYHLKIYKVNPCNGGEQYEIEKKDVTSVLKIDFLYAQRRVDDATEKDRNISKTFENIFSLKNRQSEQNVQALEEALSTFAKDLDGKYPHIFDDVFKAINQFGIKDKLPSLILKSLFNTDSLLKHNTRLYYNHEEENEHLLPESHNGLGFSNLIYIILQIFHFQEEIKDSPHLHHLILIEEPEAHLHPQMQQAFIKHIKTLIKMEHQIIITTHSSHVSSECDFEDIRYFCQKNNSIEVKNLNKHNTQDKDKRFLKQYMTQQRCDMFFADKIILIEGTTERLLLPKMIEKIDNANDDSKHKLNSQYICIIEVGGAYAHIFQSIIEFLEIKTLIITDLDSCEPDGKRTACPPLKGNAITSNQCLKDLLNIDNIAELLSQKDTDKIKNNTRISYQIKENENEKNIGRSLEEQFYYLNKTIIDGDEKLKKFFVKDEGNAQFKGKKIDFTFDIMFSETDWKVPRYIQEGLLWLANDE